MSSPQILKYQIERSDDLLTWNPFGLPARSGAANQALSRTIAFNSAHAFYRLSVTRDQTASALAAGGENVFGYADLFAQALSRIGQISPEQFSDRYDPQLPYVRDLGWDPTIADFWPEFATDPAVYNLQLIPGVDDLRQFDFRLNPAELALFKKNGFVVSEHLRAQSFGEIYNRLWTDDLPVFITTDSVLHAWHRSYDMMLSDIERSILFDNFKQMLDGMAAQITVVQPQVTDALRDSLLDADYFLAVARSLLNGTNAPNVPSILGQEQRAAATLTKIYAEQLDTCFDLFGAPRAVDFSQFTPRGHYTGQFAYPLPNYFRCLMWLGRIDLRVAGGPYTDADCGLQPHKAPLRELGTAIVLNQLLQSSGQVDRWQQSENLISTFVGWTDSLTFRELDPLLKAAGINSVADVTDTNVLTRIQAQLESGALGVQQINSDYFVSPFDEKPAALPQSFTVFGQKFVVDSWALSEVVADRILWAENGGTNKVDRRVPSALDVAFGVLDNNQIVSNLLARMKTASATNYPIPFRDGLNYQHNLAAVREVVEQHPASAWQQNIYMGWLDLLRQIPIPLASDPRMPAAMRTHAWAMKDLNTQLASWAELRHDTILYAKQSYTDSFTCSYPKGFVEPRPEFWQHCFSMATNVAALIRKTDYGSETNIQQIQISFLLHFADVANRLLTLCQKELNQQPFTPDENDFISTTLVGSRGYVGYWTVRDGWYPKLFYPSPFAFPYAQLGFDQGYGSVHWDPVIADVHTDTPCDVCGRDPGSVLYEATGNVNLLMIAVDNGSDRCVYAGPVSSYYEFAVTGTGPRLSDTDWQSRLAKAGLADYTLPQVGQPPINPDWSGVPYPPEWTQEYLVQQR